jgi:hypothetical protein
MDAHRRAEPGRHSTCTADDVLNFFMLPPHGLPLQLTPTDDGCQLSLHHSAGVVVERFTNVSSALRRVKQLNDLLSAPQRGSPRSLHMQKSGAAPRHRR